MHKKPFRPNGKNLDNQEQPSEKTRRVKLGDIVVCAVVLLTAVVCAALFWTRQDAGSVRVSVDGQVLYTVALPAQREITLDCGVTIVVDGASVYVSHSDCPDQHCVRAGAITQGGQTIVCLPNRVVVRLATGGGPDIVVGINCATSARP